MEHFHGGAGWGAGAFWLFIAAAVIAGAWEKIRKNAEKHETLRRIMEKTGTMDEARLQDLFNPRATPDWMTPVPGSGYRALRVGGTIVMCMAGGVAVFFLTLGQAGVISQQARIIGLAAAGVLAMFGVGLFVSSRFAEPPPDRGNGPAAR